MPPAVRVLLLADTHLGFDLPMRPRVDRRRRGPDFFANTTAALQPALRGEVDIVIHGGDLLFRSKVSAALVTAALEPFLEVADCGVPVVLVPGNHERSVIPFPLLAMHQNLHMLSHPMTILFDLNGCRTAVGGFPCKRNGIEEKFTHIFAETALLESEADIKLLCLHQTVEGAQVGPVDFTFRRGRDVIAGVDVPEGLAAVLAGHIHRAQTLTHDMAGRPLAAPVFYPGSIERTSRAEREEEKGFLILEIEGTSAGGRVVGKQFNLLPARPLENIDVEVSGLGPQELTALLLSEFDGLPEDAAVTVRFVGGLSEESKEVAKASRLRDLVPPSMIVEVARPTASKID